MRSAIVAALAIGALAVPFQARDVVTFVDVVYATQIVTVTQGAPAATSDSASASASTSTAKHFGHHGQWHASSNSDSIAAPSSSSSTSSLAPATAWNSAPSPPPSSTSAAPPPASTNAAPPPPPASTPAASPSPTAEVVAPVAPPPTSSYVAAPTDYAGKSLLHHNLHRSNHSAPDIAWNQSLANTAAKIAQSCVYAHNVNQDGGGYGQNIAAGVQANKITTIITDLFYNGEVGWYNNFYGQAQPDMSNFEKWGHFSQLVWKDTVSFGCATQDCSAQGLANVGSNVSPHFTVCNYYPPGNYANEYGTNVGKSVGEATVDWDAGL